MKKGFLVLLTICFVIGVVTTFAYSLDFDLTCPTAKKAGKRLLVTMNIENWDCNNSVSFSRTIVGLVGNSDDSLGGTGIWGPYKRWVSGTVPAATCGMFPTMPGTLTKRVMVTNSLPISLAGTVAMVTVLIDEDDGEEGEACMVEVLP